MIRYRRDAVVIEKAANGFIVTTKGTIEEQEDRLDQVYVFDKLENLGKWLVEHLKKIKTKENQYG